MELKYTHLDGRRSSDFVEYSGTEARYVLHPDGSAAWYDRHGLALKIEGGDSHATKNEQSPEKGVKGAERIQGRQIAQRQTRTRKRANR